MVLAHVDTNLKEERANANKEAVNQAQVCQLLLKLIKSSVISAEETSHLLHPAIRPLKTRYLSSFWGSK